MLARRLSLHAVSLIALLAAAPILAHATPPLPTGGVFAAGSGIISTSGNQESVTINGQSAALVSTSPAVINWAGGYDVAAGSTVTYTPSTTSGGAMPSIVVNSDTSGVMSSIAGTISSPDFAQVVVNPNGISIAGSAVLPGNFSAAAGSWNSSTGSVSGSNAPVTIGNGVTYASGNPSLASQPEITVVESAGDPLPLTHGMTAEVNAPANSSFHLYQNQQGNYAFNGPQQGPVPIGGGGIVVFPLPAQPASGNTVIDGSGVQVGSISVESANGTFTLQNINSSGDISATNGGGIGATPQTGTTTVSNITAAGKFGISVTMAGDVAVNGNLSAPNPLGPVDLNASAASGTGTIYGAYTAPNASATSALSIAGGTKISAGSQISVSSDNVAIDGPVAMDAPLYQIESNHAIDPAAALGASISDNSATASSQPSVIAAPSISNLSITSSGLVTIDANTSSGLAIQSAGLQIQPSLYGGDKTAAGGYAPLSVSNTRISGGGLGVQGAYGVSLNNVTEPKPAASAYPGLSIIGTVGGYPLDSTATSNSVSITNSTLYGSSGSLIMAGSSGLPGAISITGSRIETAGNETGRVLTPSLAVEASDGGTISVDATSILSVDGGGSCSISGAACSTEISSGMANFLAGNRETASGSNVYAGAISGVPNANPAETRGSSLGTLVLETNSQSGALAGSVNVAGVLDAGQPSAVVAVPPVATPAPPVVVATPPVASPSPVVVSPASTASSPSSVVSPAPASTPPPVTLPGLVVMPASVASGPTSAASPASAPLSRSEPAVNATPSDLPSAAALTTIQVRPDATIRQTEMQGSTLLVPETADTTPDAVVSVAPDSKPVIHRQEHRP